MVGQRKLSRAQLATVVFGRKDVDGPALARLMLGPAPMAAARLAALVLRRAARNLGRSMRAAAAGAVALLVLSPSAFLAAPAGAAEPEAAMRFGMDINSIQPQVDAGIKPDYGLFWVGVWNLKSGWGGPDAQMDKAYAAGVTPVIQFYYWGDDISRSCLANGCWSDLHDGWKDQANWSKLAQQLVDHLHLKMKGREAVVVVETEFNKGDVATYEPLDQQLADKARFLKQGYPNATVVLGFGNWASNYWGTWDRAVAASDMTGLQAMRGSTKNSLTSYQGLVNGTLDGAKKLQSLFGKPVFVSDIALSTYPEPEYLDHQAKVLGQLFARMDELKAAGVRALVYRTFRDNPNFDLANYYGQAERHWGLAWAGNSTWKPAMRVWVDGIQAERAAAPPPAVGRDGAAAVEAEAFAVRTAGGRQADATASGGARWNLWSNGHLEQTLDLAARGHVEVRVTAKGTALGGVAPRMVVTLGGAPVLEADPGASWTTYSAWVPVAAAGPQALRIAFTNDARSGSEDRNLLLDKAEAEWMGDLPPPSAGNSTRAEAEDGSAAGGAAVALDKAASGGKALGLPPGGAAALSLDLVEGVHAVRAVVRASGGEGGVELRVDGQPVGTRVVSLDGYRVVEAQAKVRGSGAHRVEVARADGAAGVEVRFDRVAVENLGPLPNHAPAASLAAATHILNVTVDAAASSDPDGDALTYRWDFGDGATASGPRAEHLYAWDGTYTVTLTASDGRLESTASQQVAVARPNNPPQPAMALSGVGLAVRADAAASADPDGDPMGFTWHWGDGATSTGAVAEHAYAAPGTYVVRLVADDRRATAAVERSLLVHAGSLEAEAAAEVKKGVAVEASEASGGRALYFPGNGHLADAFEVPAGEYEVTIRAAARLAPDGPAPHLVLRVDRKHVDAWFLRQEGWTELKARVVLAEGAHRVAVVHDLDPTAAGDPSPLVDVVRWERVVG